jgi:hypothetical protein
MALTDLGSDTFWPALDFFIEHIVPSMIVEPNRNLVG